MLNVLRGATVAASMGLAARASWDSHCEQVPVQKEEILSEDHIRDFHRIRDKCSKISSKDEAAANGMSWDFKNWTAIPGRVWHDETPADVATLVARPFSPAEVLDCRKRFNMDAPKHVAGPRALIVAGVAAAGKSSIVPKVEAMFNIDLNNYVQIEGDALREAHGGWDLAISQDKSVGYKDMFNKHFKKISKEKKTELMEEAFVNRQNVLWPSVARDKAALLKLIERFTEMGYKVDLVGLVVGLHESEVRSACRGHDIGRWHTSNQASWDQTYETIIALCDPQAGVDRAVIYNNQNFGNPKILYARSYTLTDLKASIDEVRQIPASEF